MEMWHFCGPGSWRTLFVTRKEIDDCVERCNAPAESATEEWDRQVVQACCHPDTKEILPWPFRMNAHVPCNTLLLLGMLSASSPMAHAVAQTANQLFNACQFYAKGNASNEEAARPLLRPCRCGWSGDCDLALERYSEATKTGIERSSWRSSFPCRRGCSQAFSNRGHEERRIF